MKSRILVMLLMLSSLMASGCARQEKPAQTQERPQETADRKTYPISRKFVSRDALEAGTALRPYVYAGKPLAGVVNHHSLAIDTLGRFFRTLKIVRPDLKTFIILSPDHFNRGQGISTDRLSYSTPVREIEVDDEKVSRLVSEGVWDGTKTRAFEDEHGVGALAPFIAYDFPGSSLVPIFLPPGLDETGSVGLANQLSAIMDDHTFVVVSSDMSHFLTAEEAGKRDKDTLTWLESNDWTNLAKATDKNTDSASGLSVLHTLLGDKKFVLLDHKNSSDYLPDRKNTTSYIIGFWE